MHRQDFFCDGALREAASGHRIEVLNPTTGAAIGSVPACAAGRVRARRSGSWPNPTRWWSWT